MKKVLNSKEAALLLGISRSTLYKLSKKEVRKIRLSEKRVGWPLSELERFITERLQNSRP